jgi:hypothetical protein
MFCSSEELRHDSLAICNNATRLSKKELVCSRDQSQTMDMKGTRNLFSLLRNNPHDYPVSRDRRSSAASDCSGPTAPRPNLDHPNPGRNPFRFKPKAAPFLPLPPTPRRCHRRRRLATMLMVSQAANGSLSARRLPSKPPASHRGANPYPLFTNPRITPGASSLLQY